eukprot:m.73131 g.73131  ORF g.73131 m.73131 type:complete len:998 (+) comp13024_c0_seq1:87-3080(+)
MSAPPLLLFEGERKMLQWLRSSNFEKHGLPAPGSREATLLASAMEKALMYSSSMLMVLDKLSAASGLTINSKALKKAFKLYVQRFPNLPADFFDGERGVGSLYAVQVTKAITRREHKQLQDMCESGLLCERDGIRLDWKSHPRLPTRPGKTARLVVRVINAGEARKLHDWDLIGRPLGETELSDRSDAHMRKTNPLVHATGVFECTIHYKPTQEGASPCLFVVNLGGTHVGLVIPLECASEYTSKEREGLVPYVARERIVFDGPESSIGDRPPGFNRRYRSELLHLPVALELSKDVVKAFGTKPIYTPENYLGIQKSLWDLERRTMKDDLATYSLRDTPLVYNPHTGLVVLLLPGLAESKPSVIRGDKIRVRNIYGQIHSGYVHRTTRDEVHLNFHPRFVAMLLPGELFDIEFVLNELQIHKRYMALEHAVSTGLLGRLLGNADPVPPAPPPLTNLRLRNKHLNEEQCLAVSTVLQQTPGSLPFIIFGPPGTGKSSTMVEAIYQVFTRQPDSRILVCTPTNAAADILLVRLVAALGPAIAQGVLFRANAASRKSGPADRPEVRDYSLFDAADDVFTLPETMEPYRVVVGTLASSQTVVDMVGGFNDITHVFVDEAGHADEAECLMCLATVACHQPVDSFSIVLAGDPFQLGPIIHNKLAAPLLSVSLLERLMGLSPYRPRDAQPLTRQQQAKLIDTPLVPRRTEELFHPSFVVKLTSNYRSSEPLFHVSAKLFYNGYLREACNPGLARSFLGWDRLPNPDMPLLVHGVRGRHLQEQSSPSFFNLEEISLVTSYVTAVLAHRRAGVQPKDIGVISPYARQCERLRRSFHAVHGWDAIKVGTVEAFQGDERRVIILTTVRSDLSESSLRLAPDAIDAFLQFDSKHHLGFLRNPKRFNVAVTRAQSLLILVGNPFVLHSDEHWGTLLRYAHARGCYTGVPFSPQPGSQQAAQLHTAFASLGLGRAAAGRDMGEGEGEGEWGEGEEAAMVEESIPRLREDF